jgi:hypothetical protein
MADDAITLQNLVKSYRSPDGPVRAVRGIDVSIERGETVALLGPNGAGKSTTLDILLGLTEPDAGGVSIFGAGPHEAISAGDVAAMLQTGGLIHDLSVRELVSMMASLYRRPLGVDDVLERTGLLASANKRTQKLSGGQAQRVRLALALGHLLSSDSIGPAVGGLVGVLALLGGSWFPISGHGFLHDLAQALPSYWLVQASHVGLADGGWGVHGWVVMGLWTIALIALANYAYQNDTEREV